MGPALPFIMVAATVAAAAVSAVATMRAGSAQAEAGKYNARVAEMNAKQARDAAALEAMNIRNAGRRTQGTARARAGASGLLLDTGSPLEVFAENAANIEREAATAIYRGEITAQGQQQRGVLERYQGSQAQSASYFTAGSTLLSGIGRATSALLPAPEPRGGGSTRVT